MLKRRTLLTGAAFSLLVIALGGVGWKMLDYRSALKQAQSEIDVLTRRIVDLEEAPALAALNAISVPPEASDAAEDLREYVYATNRVGSGEGYGSNGALIFANLGRPGSEQLCGGMSAALAWALNTKGIPARTVQLAGANYLSGDDVYETHVTVEAHIDGDWRIVDPTFNVSFNCSDGQEYLSIPEARACVEAGHDLVPVPGELQLPLRTLAENPWPYESYLAAYDRRPLTSDVLTVERNEFPRTGWLAEAQGQYEYPVPPPTFSASYTN